MCDNEDFRQFLKRVETRGLEDIEDDDKIITSFKNIQANKFYRISASYLKAVKKWCHVDTSRGYGIRG